MLDTYNPPVRSNLLPPGGYGKMRKMTPASPWLRLAARFVDMLIMLLILAPFIFSSVYVLGAFEDDSKLRAGDFVVAAIMALAGLAAAGAYEAGMTAHQGATLGKKLFGIEVVGPDGSRVSLGAASVRYTVMTLMFLTVLPWVVNTVWGLVDRQHRTWHDKLSNSSVVNDQT